MAAGSDPQARFNGLLFTEGDIHGSLFASRNHRSGKHQVNRAGRQILSSRRKRKIVFALWGMATGRSPGLFEGLYSTISSPCAALADAFIDIQAAGSPIALAKVTQGSSLMLLIINISLLIAAFDIFSMLTFSVDELNPLAAAPATLSPLCSQPMVSAGTVNKQHPRNNRQVIHFTVLLLDRRSLLQKTLKVF